MRRLASVGALTLAVWAGAGGAGCQLFMNLDVSGYDAAPPDAQACGADGACITFGCTSGADCDGGAFCCLGLAQSSSPSAASTCQPGSCGSTSIQLCKTSTECGTSGSCSSCTLGGAALSVCDSTLTSFACSP
jgi:hypothetical protein